MGPVAQGESVAARGNDLLLITGMHRSGTSAVAKAAECLGYSLGDHLMGPARDNPKGFQEDLDIWQLNETAMALLGRTWDDPRETSVDPAVLQRALLPLMLARTLGDKLSRFGDFAVKDPRICRLLPFWRDAMALCRIEPKFLLVIRHPMAVAMSLRARNGMSFGAGIDLWRVYMEPFREARENVVTVHYDEFLALPYRGVHAVAERLGRPCDEAKLITYAEGFLSRDLLHHSVLPAIGLSSTVEELWQTLLGRCV